MASVLVSMPCDVIKTRMDLHPPHCPVGGPAGALCSIKAFFETGRQLVAAGGGPHALFVGVAPRLLQVGACWFGEGCGDGASEDMWALRLLSMPCGLWGIPSAV